MGEPRGLSRARRDQGGRRCRRDRLERHPALVDHGGRGQPDRRADLRRGLRRPPARRHAGDRSRRAHRVLDRLRPDRDGLPHAVLRPGSVADIATMVGFARRHGLSIAVNGQGSTAGPAESHSNYGQALVEGGIAVDAKGLSSIHRVGDAEADVDAGVTWSELVTAAAGSAARPRAPRLPPPVGRRHAQRRRHRRHDAAERRGGRHGPRARRGHRQGPGGDVLAPQVRGPVQHGAGGRRPGRPHRPRPRSRSFRWRRGHSS